MKIGKWIALAVVFAMLWFLRDTLGMLTALLLLSATIAYIVSPLARFFEEKYSKKWGAALAFFAFLFFLAGLLIAAVPSIIRQAAAVGESIPELWDNASELLMNVGDGISQMGLPDELIASLEEQLAGIGSSLMESVRNAALDASEWISTLAWVLLSPVVAFYLLKDRTSIFSYLERLIPSAARPLVLSIAAGSREAIGQYARGQVLVSLIAGLLTALGLLIAGLPSWLLMGVVMVVFNLIPYFGPVLGAIPVLLLAAAQGWGMILKCLIAVVISQQVESMLIAPRILSSSVDLHPVIVIVALLIGNSVSGLAGMVFAIPLVLIFRVIISRCAQNRLRRWDAEIKP